MSQLRIQSGAFKGTKLASEMTGRLRPTSAKVRTAVMDILGERVVGSRFLDLFAGTGAVGFEALSRGAELIYFVESQHEHRRIISQNIEKLRQRAHSMDIQTPKIQVIARPVAKLKGSSSLTDINFDIIWADPPYAELSHHWEAIKDVVEQNLCAKGVFVMESYRHALAEIDWRGFKSLTKRRYGDTIIEIFAKSE